MNKEDEDKLRGLKKTAWKWLLAGCVIVLMGLAAAVFYAKFSKLPIFWRMLFFGFNCIIAILNGKTVFRWISAIKMIRKLEKDFG